MLEAALPTVVMVAPLLVQHPQAPPPALVQARLRAPLVVEVMAVMAVVDWALVAVEVDMARKAAT